MFKLILCLSILIKLYVTANKASRGTASKDPHKHHYQLILKGLLLDWTPVQICQEGNPSMLLPLGHYVTVRLLRPIAKNRSSVFSYLR